MGEAKRRDRPSTVGTRAQTSARVAEALLDGSPDRVALVGPLVWIPSDGAQSKFWRFIVNVGDAEGEARLGTFIDEIEAEAAAQRTALKAAFLAMSPAVEVIDCATELALTEQAAARWPTERSLRARDATAAEIDRQARLAASRALEAAGKPGSGVYDTRSETARMVDEMFLERLQTVLLDVFAKQIDTLVGTIDRVSDREIDRLTNLLTGMVQKQTDAFAEIANMLAERINALSREVELLRAERGTLQ
jgi:hypothetical protein